MSAPGWLVARPIAHRGLHAQERGLIENGLSAARAAVERGFSIECDVQVSSDGEAIVFHDFTLDRLTGESGPVRGRTAAALGGLVLSGSGDDRVPTLAGLLDAVAGRVPLVVEIKSAFDGDLALTRRTVELALAYAGPIALKSFDPGVVAEVRRLAPDLPRGIVAQARYDHAEWDVVPAEVRAELGGLLHFERTDPTFVSWRVGDLPHPAPYLARLLGSRPVMTWTVRTEADRAQAARHADQMVFEGFVP